MGRDVDLYIAVILFLLCFHVCLKSWLKSRCGEMSCPINCCKLTSVDGFWSNSSVNAILNTLDIEMNLGTFLETSVWSLWKLLPLAWAGDARM